MLNRRKLIVFILFLPFMSCHASDYSQGFEAYLAGDYQNAEKLWGDSANKGDAKSMFNLGLLHEQSKLANSDIELAESWYKKASDNGYSAAGFHLAQRLLERGGSDDEALELIRVAANEGYVPAIRFNGASQRSKANVSSNASKSTKVNSKRFQTESWINAQRGRLWTVQLLAFTDEVKVQQFIAEHDLSAKAAYFAEKMKDGVVWYKLIYGSYDSKDKASFARQNLSVQLREYGPWLRQFKSVHAITKSE